MKFDRWEGVYDRVLQPLRGRGANLWLSHYDRCVCDANTDTREKVGAGGLLQRGSCGITSSARRSRQERRTCCTKIRVTARATSRTWELLPAATCAQRSLSTVIRTRLEHSVKLLLVRFNAWGQCRIQFKGPVWARAIPPYPVTFPLSSLSFCIISFFPFLIHASSIFLLFIPSHSTRIVSLRFHARMS